MMKLLVIKISDIVVNSSINSFEDFDMNVEIVDDEYHLSSSESNFQLMFQYMSSTAKFANQLIDLQ